MKLNKKIIFGMFLLATILLFSNFLSAYMQSNIQGVQFTSKTEGEFNKEVCQEGHDFIIQLTPFGCTPMVVRSDLLEESDVPVYCQLGATKINPLIDVQAIDSISLSGTYSSQIASVGFHPAKAALGIEGQLNSPVLNNIGYVVIVLKKQTNASAMPDYVTGTLTAKIKYNINNAFGIGKAMFYIPEISSNEDLENQKNMYSFWGGRGYLTADNIDSNSAQISLYSQTGKISTVNLQKGESSQNIYLPGFECQAGLKLKLESLDNANTRAKLRVNAEVVEVAQGEKFLDNKCQVRNLQANGLVQRIGLKCQEDTGMNSFDLTISPKLILKINNEDREVSLGEKLYEKGDKGVYLGYIGADKNSEATKKDLFIYLVSMPSKNNNLTGEQLSSITSLVEDLNGAGQTSTGLIDRINDALNAFAGLSTSLGAAIGRGETYYRINFKDNGESYTFSNGEKLSVSMVDFAGSQNLEFSDINLGENYENAKTDYETLRKDFSSEEYKTAAETTTYGEEALYKEILLAGEAEQKRTVYDLCNEFSQAYPSSAKIIEECSDFSRLSSQEIGGVYLTINKQIKKLSFDGIYEPSFEEYGARIMINAPTNGGNFDLRKSQLISGTGFSIQLLSLSDESARVNIITKTSKGTKTEIVSLAKDVTNDFDTGYAFTLTKINLKKVAKVSVNPNIDNSGSQANFSFKIGIEKRAINLAPEQTKEAINKLNKWINTWSNISNVLGKGVEGLKTACMITGATLVAKSFITNSQGGGVARQAIMRGTNGWFEKCAEMVAAKTYVSQEKCFLENANKIDVDVAEMSKLISEQNYNFNNLQSKITKTKFLSENVVNTSALMEDYSEQQISYLGQNLPSDALVDPSGKGERIDKNQLLSTLSYENWEKGQYSLEQLKEIELYTKVLKDTSASPELQEMAKAKLYSVMLDIQTTTKTFQLASSFDQQLNNRGLASVGDTDSYGNDKAIKGTYNDGTVKGSQLEGLEADKTYPAKSITYNSKKYILVLEEGSRQEYFIKKVYDGETLKSLSSEEEGAIKYAFSSFKKYDSSSYNNQYKNPQVRYYETEPYKGMPAIVPFDLKNGWYAATKQTIPIGSNIESYYDSGEVSSFWVCNVGKDGLEQFQTTGDDICEMINTGTQQSYNQFPGITNKDEASKIITKAKESIEQASKVSESQRKGEVTIAGQKINVGSPAVDIPGFECQDFMSPKDCLLLFNVCDPVICPSSRCDLGGAYPVKDVVQSGIIGSIALCFPNHREGIIFPVCLTGVKAGIDSFLSVLTATRDCLQENLDTGKTVGICDEIFSVYMCDFFWKQAAPLTDMIIPKLISMISGQNTRGGGEYLGVANAWSAAEKSVSYFTNYYAASAKQAFLARTTETVQGEFCKSFISGVVPSGGDVLSTLTESDSPPQFTGRFEEIEFTTATVPSTSQYKVFYHIFAGKDSGAYYQVYLKGSSSSSYYQDTSSNYNVASGYISVGDYASETKDFLTTSGYRELCISVNGQEECGFQEVSTSFAVNYIKDEYLASQAKETGITKESNCISGSASAYSLLSGNIQSAAEEMIDPAIYNQGITRICATSNPGQGTDPYIGTEKSRWVDVGYCDNTKVRCWLDTQSVEDVIKTTTVEGEALEEVTGSYLNVLKNQEGYLNKEEFSSKLVGIKEEKEDSKKITLINEIYEKVFWSNEKASLLNLRAETYAKIFRELWKNRPKPEAVLKEKPTTPSEEQPTNKTTATTELALGDISGLSTIRQKILTKANSLIGTRSGMAIHCWDAVYTYVYADVGVGTSCIYSDKTGKSYTIMNDKMTSGPKTITIGVSKRGETIICKYSSCTKNSADTSTSEKLDLIQPGDLLSIVWDESWAHNVIFVKWTDRAKGLAQVFDWNGVISGGDKFSNGIACSSSYYSPIGNFCKSFRYYITDLGDTGHPVYVIMQPVGDTTQKPVCDVTSCSAMPPSADGENPISTAFTENTSKTVRERIYQAAVDYSNAQSKDVAAKFVSNVLIKAGVTDIQSTTEVSSLVSMIERKSEFSEVLISNRKIGDIVLLGNACGLQSSIGIIQLVDSSGKIYFYTNLKDKVTIENIPNTGIQNGPYVYKIYRYNGDTKETAGLRNTKWTLDTAITETERILKLPNRNKGGTYTDNKLFVDQLIFDGILTEKECGEARGTGGFFGQYGGAFLQKSMDWVKTVLLQKKAGTTMEIPSTKYNNFKTLFEKYSKQNLPTVYDYINLNEFKALLVAIGHQNNWGESTRGGSDWLMGFNSGDVNYQGEEKQISTASFVIKNVLNHDLGSTSSPYNPCISSPDLDLKCVLSVYHTEKDYSVGNKDGKDYADSVLSLWEKWKDYFDYSPGA